jgi:polar amino acid transport system substrate-binding protein
MGRIRLSALLVCVVGLIALTPVRGDTLEEIKKRGRIRWGGDQEGGAPYVYPDPNAPRVAGFEVDLMDLLAERLGVKAEFQQGEWTNLPDLLRTEGIDVIVNGYELTEKRLETMIATIPYYVYELQLIARRDDQSIQSWGDFKKPETGTAVPPEDKSEKRKVIGVLVGSAAEKYVRERLGNRVEIRGYQGFTDAMQEVQNGKLDATVQDLPPAIFYRERYSSLHFVGSPVGRGYYVMYVRKGDERLRDALDDGIRELNRPSPLKTIYRRYGIWNEAQDRIGSSEAENVQATEGGEEGRNWLLLIAEAAWRTIYLSIMAMPLAIMAGLLIALGRLYAPGWVGRLLAVFVEVIRGTPLLLQLYTIFFILPGLGIKIDPVPAAVIGLAINYSAYEAEIYRAGLLAIPPGQMEAALALGMSRGVALRRVIVPQAVRMVIPPVTNDFIALFKDTSICSVVTVVELTKQYSILSNSTGAWFEFFTITAFLYLMMSYPLSVLARRLEWRFRRVAG